MRSSFTASPRSPVGSDGDVVSAIRPIEPPASCTVLGAGCDKGSSSLSTIICISRASISTSVGVGDCIWSEGCIVFRELLWGAGSREIWGLWHEFNPRIDVACGNCGNCGRRIFEAVECISRPGDQLCVCTHGRKLMSEECHMREYFFARCNNY